MEARKFIVIEFFGRGDPFFGGAADDRTLCVDGIFRSTGTYSRDQVARFGSREEALETALGAGNLRAGGLVSAMEEARR